MTKSKSKKLYVILFSFLFGICAIFMPFIFSKNKNKVFADVGVSNTYEFNSEIVATQMVRALTNGRPSSFVWSESLTYFVFTPIISHNATTNKLSVTFQDMYYSYFVNNADRSAALSMYELSTTTVINNLTLDYDFPYGGSVTEPDRYSVVKNCRLSNQSTANYGFMFDIYMQQHTPVIIDGVATPVEWFDYSKLYSVSYSYGTHHGLSNTFMIKYTCLGDEVLVYDAVTDRYTPSGQFSTLSICLLIELPSTTYFNNFYSRYGGQRTNEIAGYDLVYYFNGSVPSSNLQQLNDSYNSGYMTGYAEGESDGYDNGYSAGNTTGYDNGYSDGDSAGYSRGLQDANQYSFMGLIGATIDAPIKALTGLLDFDILGINLSAFVYGLFSITLVIIVIKYIKGSK